MFKHDKIITRGEQQVKGFENIYFHGELRDYQERIIKRSQTYLKDHKIHIVAPPGSGKTILGLELIRQLQQPTLILSPSIIIRQQWGERFEESFLENQNIEDYVSYDIKNPKLLNCMTYQAFYAAYKKIENEEKEEDIIEFEDYTQFNLMQIVRKTHIKTICLDEAHHLKSEWQKVLENFLVQLPHDFTIISLTATPPYDSSSQEWKKYTNLCGEIDEEIFVPELVAQKNLCPHQDYIYFNYPTIEETKIIQQHQEKITQCIQNILYGTFFQNAISASHIKEKYMTMEEMMLENIQDFIALFTVAKFIDLDLPKKLIKIISPKGKLPKCTLYHVEQALEFIINQPDIFTEEISSQLKSYLSQNYLFERKQVRLISNDRMNKLLVSSRGKLKSIQEIVEFESNDLKEDLHMLILTDHIKKDLCSFIGTNQDLLGLGCVTIFESLRRKKDVKSIGVLSGSLIIVSNHILTVIKEFVKAELVSCTFVPFQNTEYSQVIFNCSQKKKVRIMTKAFEQGYIQVLIGTKSLLGEGWDCPCINSLILATTVGSFVLSNQMRGRAIRTDKNNLYKTSHIWHLITIEPPLVLKDQMKQSLFHLLYEDAREIKSYDYDVLKKRFDCFLGPAYHQNIIESGIERLDIIQPPYTREHIHEINQQMLTLSKERDQLRDRWNMIIGKNIHPEVHRVNKFSPKIHPKGYFYQNALLLLLVDMLFGMITRLINRSVYFYADTFIKTLLADMILAVIGYILAKYHIQLLQYLTPQKMIASFSQCILKTLKEMGEISKQDVDLCLEIDDEEKQCIYTVLQNASLREQTIFAESMAQFLSYIDNPRYIFIKQVKIFGIKRLNYTMSFACPTLIGTKKENAEILLKNLKKMGDFHLIYTRQEEGRKELLKCRRYSYVGLNESYIVGKKIMRHDWE